MKKPISSDYSSPVLLLIMQDNRPLRIAIIAGESSGDQLGGKLMQALNTLSPYPIIYIGVGGDTMQAAGLTGIFPMSELSLMGFAEIIPHIPRLLARIKETAAAIQAFAPDLVITIDSPDFCFRVIKKLSLGTVPFVHYVAPSVWVYRAGRAAKIAALYDHLLTLLPFEPPYFEKHGLKCTFIGHPIIENKRSACNGESFRKRHHIDADSPVICMLPGSRMGELERMWPVFAETLELLIKDFPRLTVVIPAVSHLAENIRKRAVNLPVPAVVITDADEKAQAIACSNVALTKSGTGALELAFAGLPMVVGYRVNAFSAWLFRRLSKIRYVNLVNLILNREAIPEFIQERCTAVNLAKGVHELLSSDVARKQQQEASLEAMRSLGYEDSELPSEKAAKAVLGLVK